MCNTELTYKAKQPAASTLNYAYNNKTKAKYLKTQTGHTVTTMPTGGNYQDQDGSTIVATDINTFSHTAVQEQEYLVDGSKIIFDASGNLYSLLVPVGGTPCKSAN